MLKADFHVHSRVSDDANIDPEELAEKAKGLGFDIIALTNHNTLEGYGELVEASKRVYPGLIVLKGVEIDTREGEIIALCIENEIPKKMGLAETCRLVRDQGGFIIIPHLFDRFRKGIGNSVEKIIDYVDAIEGFNSRSLFDSFNRKNVSFARKSGKPVVAGSDSHFIEEFGSAYTLLDSGRKREEILESIRKGRTEIFGEKTGLKPHWKTFIEKLR